MARRAAGGGKPASSGRAVPPAASRRGIPPAANRSAVQSKPVRRAAPRLSLTVQGGDRFAGLPPRATLARWISAALTGDADITLRFVGSREGERLNREFRGKEYATDVLTFAYPPPAGGAGPVRADIVICPPVVRMGARRRGRTWRDHLAHLVVHGTLHAQGHDHMQPDAAAAMEACEVRILSRLGVGNPYVATDAAP